MSNIYLVGTGILSCIGNDVEEFWDSLTSENAIENYQMPIAIPSVIDSKAARRMDRFSKLAVTAAKSAFDSSSFCEENMDPLRIGTIFSSYYGSIVSNISFGRKLLQSGVDMVSPTLFASTVHNASVGHTCINLGVKGVSTLLIGGNSIGYSYDLLKEGLADGILCGGIEEYCQDLQDCYKKEDYISKEENCWCRPLINKCDGTKITEASAIMMLEAKEEGDKRPENALCEVMGYGNAFSPELPGRAMESMNESPFVLAMETALRKSNVSREQIDGIFVAANGVKCSDEAEIKAIHQVFGERAASIPITAIKEKTGETLGASFSVNVIAAAKSLQKQMIPPMMVLPGESFVEGINPVLPGSNIGDYTYFLVNGYDFNGSIYSFILKK